MVCIRENSSRGSEACNSSLALLARLLDGAGRPVRVADVVSLRCSIREAGAREPDLEFEVCPHEVLLPALATSNSWTVDNIGYNFRHNLANAADLLIALAPEFSGRVEVRYVFTLINCTQATVSFRLKLV